MINTTTSMGMYTPVHEQPVTPQKKFNFHDILEVLKSSNNPELLAAASQLEAQLAAYAAQPKEAEQEVQTSASHTTIQKEEYPEPMSTLEHIADGTMNMDKLAA